MTTESLRYPLGQPEPISELPTDERARKIDDIARLPAEVRAAVAGLSDSELDRSYREGGWTIRQIVHHLVDSHVNAYTRFRLALTEDHPTVRPYDEAAWAELPDVFDTPIETSLSILDGIHERWVRLVRALKPEQFARTVQHPEGNRTMSLDRLLNEYSWHGRHHLEHIRIAKESGR